jgi:L-threonylcarbamoyladenylate synthase
MWLDDDPQLAVITAATHLKAGEPVVFPTDTVYGILARITSQQGYEAIYRLKGRQQKQPLAVLVAADSSLDSGAIRLLSSEQEMSAAFVVGKLTVVAAADCFPPCKHAAAIQSLQPGTIGIRRPAHPELKQLLEETGGALWATSANPSGTETGGTAELRAWLGSLDNQPALAVYSRSYMPKPASAVAMYRSGDWTYLRR